MKAWIKTDKVYVEQNGRFSGDEEFWKSRLGKESNVHPVFDGEKIRFYLYSSEDFVAFDGALASDLKTKTFGPNPPAPHGHEAPAESET